jgi:hypothetical protein
MPVIIRIAIQDDKTLQAPKKNQILTVSIFLCGSAKKTARLFLAKDELLPPGCPESLQVKTPVF